MNNLEQYIYAKLDAMQTEKSQTNTEPRMITKQELFAEIDKDIRSILNQWFRSKQVKVHKTIHSPNQDYVELVKKED